MKIPKKKLHYISIEEGKIQPRKRLAASDSNFCSKCFKKGKNCNC